ncbi:hypothetical protein Q3A66_07140 [Hymenobacter sp. BT770]|uniref:HipA family kinase n=1 Tax=Hymenobacter sp. BT770 TaxID=2886942 RepID=UPI001D103199|nr:HipA family kinase [Hymenobacter sp. BT770]MCC3152764.1 hypothetical protein [Hymenobacter sp. BT770]MDO3414839.1 hypothetical protein [Hymenobacter sp. BT770]
MLPIYQALSFIEELSGGSTRPWAILAVSPAGKSEKVAVKLFREYHFRQYAAIANEVFGAVLAEEFDLQCPSAVLIDFSPEFLETLQEPQQEQLRTVPPGLKIGSTFIEGGFPFSPALGAKALADYDQETIYAFDSLILNVDRRPDKPNILLLGAEAYLIDHEMTLEGVPGALIQLREERWEHYCAGHLFYRQLRNRSPDKVQQSFLTFGQLLRRLNPNLLEPYQRQLEELGLGHRRFEELLEYLCQQKAQYGKFEALLRKTLQ